MNRTLLLTPMAFIMLAGCHSAPSAPQEQPAVVASIVTVFAHGSSSGVSLSGVVHPSLETDLSSQVTAPIAAVTKHQGDAVRRGEVLVRLHAPVLQAGVAQADAAVLAAQQQSVAAQTQAKLAADTLARYQQLRERHSVTPHELDQMRSQSAAAQAQQQGAQEQVAMARAALALQRANAADAVLVAPFDGVVTQRNADPGALAVPGVPILHLQSSGRTEVQFSLPDDLLSVLHPKSSVQVTSGDDTATATVTSISPAGDATSHSFLVKASLPATAKWNTGAVVRVLVPSLRPSSSLMVPVSALLQQGGLDAVLILTPGNQAEVRYVTLGDRSAGTVTILTGVKAGDRILVHGDLNLAGRRIEVR